jgi:hypothetical protein
MAGSATLARTSITPLGGNEFMGNYNVKYTIPYTVVATGTGFEGTATTEDITVTLGSLPATWVVDKSLVHVTEAFANGTGTILLALGTTSSTSAFMTATTVATAGFVQPTHGTNSLDSPSAAAGTASAAMVATFTAGDVAASTISAGSLDIYLSIIDFTNPR